MDHAPDLAQMTIEQLAALGAAMVTRRRGVAADAVRLGLLLDHVERARRFAEAEAPDALAWAARHLRLGEAQVRRYLAVRALPLDLVDGREIDLQRLEVIARAAAPLWPALLAAAEEAPRQRLLLGARAGEARLRQGDRAGAAAHAEAVARGLERPLRSLRQRSPRPLSAVGRRTLGQVRRLRAALESAGAPPEAPRARRQRGAWQAPLREEAAALLRALAALLGCAPAELARLSEAPDPRGSSEEKDIDFKQLHEDAAASASAAEAAADLDALTAPASAEAPASEAQVAEAEAPPLPPPLLIELHKLGEPLADALYSVLSGAPEDRTTTSLHEALQAVPAPGAGELLAALTGPDAEARWDLAFRVMLGARPRGYGLRLHLLRTSALPRPRRERVLRSCAQVPLYERRSSDEAMPRPA